MWGLMANGLQMGCGVKGNEALQDCRSEIRRKERPERFF